jgi:hypothetical protein
MFASCLKYTPFPSFRKAPEKKRKRGGVEEGKPRKPRKDTKK